MRILLLFWAVLLFAGSVGCRKKEAAPPPPAAPVAEQPAVTSEQPADQPESAPAPSQPEPPPPPPTPALLARADNAVVQSVVGEVDAVLTGELRAFIQQKKRMPATFAEFAGLRLDSIPRPPEGKKWVIDTETLEVKAVASR